MIWGIRVGNASEVELVIFITSETLTRMFYKFIIKITRVTRENIWTGADQGRTRFFQEIRGGPVRGRTRFFQQCQKHCPDPKNVKDPSYFDIICDKKTLKIVSKVPRNP